MFNHKKIISIIILTLLLFFVYWYFFISKKDTITTSAGVLVNQTSKNNFSTGDASYDKDFVASLVGLSNVNLNTSIFQSKTYQYLNYPETPFTINYSTESGRDNPFLPIGVDLGDIVNITQSKTVIPEAPAIATTTTSTSTNRLNVTPSTTPTPKPKTF